MRETKREMKKYLDMQVEEKKKLQQYERVINDEQARIWQTDARNFLEQEKELFC